MDSILKLNWTELNLFFFLDVMWEIKNPGLGIESSVLLISRLSDLDQVT